MHADAAIAETLPCTTATRSTDYWLAQAMAGPLQLLTSDPLLKPYSELVTVIA